jgi:hypothetical protein
MNRALTIFALGTALPALATTYTVPAGSTSATIQAIVNAAGAAPGNTVAFSAGVYNLTSTISLPCNNGTVYTGPVIGTPHVTYSNTGVMSLSNLPMAVLTVSRNQYVFAIKSNGVSFTVPTAGCTVQYMGFNGTQGGIWVDSPASGITLQYNAFYNNNPPWNNAMPDANAAIYLDGENGAGSPSGGVSYISILWNSFFNNCASIQANAWPDAGGDCNAIHVQSYNNHLVIQNNIVNQTEQGFKFYEQPYEYPVQFNVDVENNNMQGNSRILIEDQQPTNANAVFSHNAFYQPTNPSYNTFELSMPLNQCVNSPAGCSGKGEGAATVADDNVYIGNVPVTITGSGAHYGIGLEQWGVGATATNSLFQGGNGPDTCEAGYGCSSWSVVVGLPFSNVKTTNNYFSGYDVGRWGPFGYEAGATAANAGMSLSPNTMTATSTTIPTVAPTILAAPSSQGYNVTITDRDTMHRLSFFYTTDGTTPAIFGPGGSAGTTKVYQGPFTVAAGTTIKAIASWGAGANQGIVFPSFGYVPSAVTTLTVTPATRSLVGAYLRANANSIAPGSTLQLTAYGMYSDGTSAPLPDAQGNAVTLWNTSNHAIAKVSTRGHLTALANGQVNVQATVGNVKSTIFPLVVSPVASAHAVSAFPPLAEANQSTANSLPQTSAEGSAGTGGGSWGDPEGGTPSGGGSAGGTSSAAGPIPAGAGPALADSFDGPFWMLVKPAGGSASISGGHLFLGVPGGSNHDPFMPSNQAVRVVQKVGNADFDVAIKIDSPLVATDRGTSQGLMVTDDDQNFITFALTTDGSSVGLKAVTVTGGAPATVLEDRALSEYKSPMYLRLSRSGSAYVGYYSADGETWTQATSFNFSQAPTAIGPFASNYSDTPANAVPVVMAVNWFAVQP